MNYIVTDNPGKFRNLGYKKFFTYEQYLYHEFPTKIAFDSETTGLNWKKHDMFCFQIGTGNDNFIVEIPKDKFSRKELLNKVVNNELVFHNALFDLKFFYKEGIYPEKVRDSYLASCIVYNGLPLTHSFKECMYRELNIEYNKNARENITTTKLTLKENIEYCFNDVDKLLLLENTLYKKLIDYGSTKSYSLHCHHIQALTYIEMCGLPISKDSWKAKMESDSESLLQASDKVRDYIYHNIKEKRDNQLDLFSNTPKIKVKLTSPTQMLSVFNKLGINTVSKEGNQSIKEDVIKKTKHEFVDLWLEFQEHLHNVSTFGKNILDKIEDNRIYTEFKPILDTARLASRKGAINFLNFPANKMTRDCFRSEKGRKIVVSDFSGQENFVTADLTGDKVMMEACLNGLDLHCAFARLITPEIAELSDEDIINNHKSKRNAAKAPRFAFAFGGNSFTVASNLNIPIEEGIRLENLYKELHPGIFSKGEETLKIALSKGYIQSAGGFILHLPFFSDFKFLESTMNSIDWKKYKRGKLIFKGESKEEVLSDYDYYMENKTSVSKFFSRRGEYLRLCMNNPCQTTAAHQTKLATYYLFKEIKKNNHLFIVRIANIIHDEAVIDLPEELAEQYRVILEECMVKGGNHYIKNPLIKMKAEANIGNSWYEAK